MQAEINIYQSSNTQPPLDGSINLFKLQKRKSRQRSLWAFLIPIAIMFFGFGIQGVFPFGDRHILTVDLYHQYAPFLIELRHKLASGDGLFFSWSGGLGLNFYSLLSYYLASPLNFLTLVFPETLLSETVLSLVLLKIGLASCCFHIFIKKYFHRDGPLALAFAVAYGLSGYSMAYFFNIMWLDTLYFLPLLCLCLVRLMRDKLYAPYIFCLGLTLASNFYSGFFAAFFIFFFFFILLERENLVGFRANFLVFCRVAIATIFGLALCALTLYPTYEAMKLTSAVGDSFPSNMQMLFPNIDFLSRLLVLAPISIRSGMANIYAGIFVLPLLFTYFISKRVPHRRKLANAAFLLFLFVSLNNNYLNFIWHGFHFPNQLPYRNSFVVVFFLLFLAYDALAELKVLNKFQISHFTLGLIILLLVLQKTDKENYAHLSLAVSIVFLICYAIMFSHFARPPRHSAFAPQRAVQAAKLNHYSLILAAVIILELVLNCFISIDRVEDDEYFGFREGYTTGAESTAIYEMVDQLQLQSDGDLVRIEIRPDKCVNDAMLYRTNGLSIFSSTFPQQSVEYMGQLGYPNNTINSFQYMGSTPVLDSILGLDYIIQRDDQFFEDTYHELAEENEEIKVYKAEHALPLAFLTNIPAAENLPYLNPDSQIEEIENLGILSAGGPFKEQETLFNNLTGIYGKNIFEEENWLLLAGEESGLSISGTDGNYSIDRGNTYNASAKFSYTVKESGNYYISWHVDDLAVNEVKVSRNNEKEIKVGRKSQAFAEIGYHEKGDELKLTLDLSDSKHQNEHGSLTLKLVKINDKNFREGLEVLQNMKSQVVSHTSNTVDIKTAHNKDAVLFFATTANPGWQAYMDGQEVPLRVYKDAFIVLPVAAGEHQIRLEFTPPGFRTALMLSGIALISTVIFAVMDVIYWRNKKQKIKAAQNLKEPAISPEAPDLSRSYAAGWPRLIQKADGEMSQTEEDIEAENKAITDQEEEDE